MVRDSVIELSGDCVAEFGQCDRHAWNDVVSRFRDANLYQTWSYDRLRYRERDVVHMTLRREGTVVAAAQARVTRLPGTTAGIAYVRWGPMWRAVGAADDTELFRQAVRALRNEFSHRRRLVLRLYPLAYRGEDDAVERILRDEGYRPHPTDRSERTLIIDLTPPLEALRAGLDQKWRNMLNQAERNGLELVEGEEEALFEEIAALHGEMTARKRLDEVNDVPHLKRVQRDLPKELKLRVVVCRAGGVPCAGAIFSAMGTMGLYVRGATGDVGLKSKGSYLVQWAFVRWLKEGGFLAYDLNGANPDANPGTYHFKRGLAGKRGRDVELLGRFQVADGRVSLWVVRGGERLASSYRRIGRALRDLRRRESGSPMTAPGTRPA